MSRNEFKICPFLTATYEKDNNPHTEVKLCTSDCKLCINGECALVILAKRQLYREFSD